ncbi:hypothetical protein Tco_0312479 [Tanacetum coccineum]
MIQHEFITLTLAQFGQILKISYNGQAVFTNEWDLASLEYFEEIEGPYCTDLPTPDNIRQLLELERVMFQVSSPSAPNAPSKTPSTKDTSSSSIDYTPKSPTLLSSPSTNGYLNSPLSTSPRVPPPSSTQAPNSMEITLSLSPITPLDVHHNSPSLSPPIIGHPIPGNLLKEHDLNPTQAKVAQAKVAQAAPSSSFASVLNNTQTKKSVTIKELRNSEVVAGARVLISLAAVEEVSSRFVNTLYGYFIGKRLAFPLVENYVKNSWAKFGLKRIMLDRDFFLFQFENKEGICFNINGGNTCCKSFGASHVDASFNGYTSSR